MLNQSPLTRNTIVHRKMKRSPILIFSHCRFKFTGFIISDQVLHSFITIRAEIIIKLCIVATMKNCFITFHNLVYLFTAHSGFQYFIKIILGKSAIWIKVDIYSKLFC